MNRIERIKKIIQDNFNITKVRIIDNSSKHNGHAGIDSNSSETHLLIELKADDFKQFSRVERERAIHALMKEEYTSDLHALQIVFK